MAQKLVQDLRNNRILTEYDQDMITRYFRWIAHNLGLSSNPLYVFTTSHG